VFFHMGLEVVEIVQKIGLNTYGDFDLMEWNEA
jgi:hypothetical protein